MKQQRHVMLPGQVFHFYLIILILVANVGLWKYGQNMVGYPPCTSFPEELLDFRDQVFCDLGTTDVCLFKNRKVDFAK